MPGRIHVMAAALRDERGRVLIQRRPAGAHLGGLWEFPGGKREAGETRRAALARELREELGIEPADMAPLIAVPHDYPDKRVLLDVWLVERWTGEVRAREAQPLAWAAPEELARFEFPAADRPVLSALTLPALVLVTPSPADGREAWLQAVCEAARTHRATVQVRLPDLEPGARSGLASEVVRRLAREVPGVRVTVNGDPAHARAAGAHGVHLPSRRLWQTRHRPAGLIASASCHDAAELERAGRLGLDYALLGPVQATATHPGAAPLGWDGFERLVARARLPVYAIGGMTLADVETARLRGGQGIAAIRGLWPGPVSAPGA